MLSAGISNCFAKLAEPENILPELKTVLPNVRRRCASARQADFVIEGYVDPTEPLRDEGPFGDHTGYYTLPKPYPVFHVTAITHRKDAVYPATIVGMPPMEDFYIGGASVKLFLPIFKMNFPEIVDLALLRLSRYRGQCWVCRAREVYRLMFSKSTGDW